jgi:hypothetical protein
MSAEVPTPNPEKPPSRSQVVRSNRRQMLLSAALTLLLTIATVAWGGRTWLRNSETLIFAVGDGDSADVENRGRGLRDRTISADGLQTFKLATNSSATRSACAGIISSATSATKTRWSS